MIDAFLVLPIGFWFVIAIFMFGTLVSLSEIRNGAGMPKLAVLGTVFVWYVGDAIYNEYAVYHYLLFSEKVLSQAWWQVFIFLFTFLLFTSVLNSLFNKHQLKFVADSYQVYRKDR